MFRDAVEAPQVAFGLVPEALNAVDVIPIVGKQCRVVYALVIELRYIKRIIA